MLSPPRSPSTIPATAPKQPKLRSYHHMVLGTIEELWKAIRDDEDTLFRLSDALPPSLQVTAPPSSVAGSIPVVLEDTHVNRVRLYPAPNYPVGSFFVETDRTVLYVIELVGNVNTWVYIAGTYHAAFPSRPTDLGANDSGFLWNSTDFVHVLLWTGTIWTWGPGDSGSGMIVGFAVDPFPTFGWNRCDGSTIQYLKSDGTLGVITLPDLATAANKAAYAKLGGAFYTGVPVAAVAPTLNSTAVTGNNTTGITNPANTGSSVTGDTIPANTGIPSATVVVASGAGTAVGQSNHTHAEGPVTSPGHTHTIGAPTDPGHTHTIAADTANADGEPRNIFLNAWFRR